MKLLSLLKDAKSVAVDTAPFIYFIEENPTYINIVEPLFQEIGGGISAPSPPKLHSLKF